MTDTTKIDEVHEDDVEWEVRFSFNHTVFGKRADIEKARLYMERALNAWLHKKVEVTVVGTEIVRDPKQVELEFSDAPGNGDGDATVAGKCTSESSTGSEQELHSDRPGGPDQSSVGNV